jgi:hypothetical protein
MKASPRRTSCERARTRVGAAFLVVVRVRTRPFDTSMALRLAGHTAGSAGPMVIDAVGGARSQSDSSVASEEVEGHGSERGRHTGEDESHQWQSGSAVQVATPEPPREHCPCASACPTESRSSSKGSSVTEAESILICAELQ